MVHESVPVPLIVDPADRVARVVRQGTQLWNYPSERRGNTSRTERDLVQVLWHDQLFFVSRVRDACVHHPFHFRVQRHVRGVRPQVRLPQQGAIHPGGARDDRDEQGLPKCRPVPDPGRHRADHRRDPWDGYGIFLRRRDPRHVRRRLSHGHGPLRDIRDACAAVKRLADPGRADQPDQPAAFVCE